MSGDELHRDDHSSHVAVERRSNLLIAACEPEWEIAVRDDLRRQLPSAVCDVEATGWVRAAGDIQSANFYAGFARQMLPHAVEVSQPSISKTAAVIAQEIGQRLDQQSGPWRWQVFSVPQPAFAGAAGLRRCELLQDAVLEQLGKRYRRLAKRANVDSRAGYEPDESLAQFGVLSVERGFVSVLTPDELSFWKHAVSSWRGGDLEVPHDRAAPSRACQKLYEVETRYGRPFARGEKCVDLGASPGGWTWVALQRGASVIAVDRSPLREDLMDHPRVQFVSGDAFKFAPPEQVDWLLSDIIAFPPRIFELLEHWIGQKWCRRFCVTIKFRGRDDDHWLGRFAELLAQTTSDFELRRLKVNHNEATVVGTVKSD